MTEGDVRITRYESYQYDDERHNLKKNKSRRAAIAVATTTSAAEVRDVPCQLSTYQDGAGHAGVQRNVRFE